MSMLCPLHCLYVYNYPCSSSSWVILFIPPQNRQRSCTLLLFIFPLDLWLVARDIGGFGASLVTFLVTLFVRPLLFLFFLQWLTFTTQPTPSRTTRNNPTLLHLHLYLENGFIFFIRTYVPVSLFSFLLSCLLSHLGHWIGYHIHLKKRIHIHRIRIFITPPPFCYWHAYAVTVAYTLHITSSFLMSYFQNVIFSLPLPLSCSLVFACNLVEFLEMELALS